MTIPWLELALAFATCLLVSAAGFRRVYYFVSLCYAGSIAAQSMVMALLYRDTIASWALLQIGLLAVYGVRLGGFLAWRERSPHYQKELAIAERRTSEVTLLQKLVIWLGVSVLFVLLVLPALLTLSAQAQGAALSSLPWGVAVMLAGLVLESWADRQKYRFKAQHPSRYCDVGLYRWSRCANYFGEMLFWFGVWLSGVSAYGGTLAWFLATAGLLYIEVLMIAAAHGLELKQDERYGADPRYRDYVRTVPVLFPWVPIYSLHRLKLSIR
jgi:steroid 5-alpha reductase family enzyme